MLAEKILAASTILVCLAMLLRLALGQKRRARLDQAALRAWRGAQALWQRPARNRQAHHDAQELIRRAQTKARRETGKSGRWDGNVYTPDSFGPSNGSDRPPSGKDLH